MKLSFATLGLLSSAPSGAYSQNSFTDMVDAARAKFYDYNKSNNSGFLRGQRYPTDGDTTEERTPTTSSRSAFGTELFLEVSDSTLAGENILLSPLSVYDALWLLKDGATEDSKNEYELEQVLGSTAPASVPDCKDDNGVTMNVATSIWANDIKQSYTKNFDNAFPKPSTFAPINEWIEDETHGLIKDFMPAAAVPPGPTLVSTVYFKGKWSTVFDPEQTKNGEFTSRGGSIQGGRFMTDTRSVEVIDRAPQLGGASAILLNYGEDHFDSDFASMFILPADDTVDSMESIISGLATSELDHSQTLSDLLDNATYDRVHIELPRFKIDYGIKQGPAKLNEELQNMGIKTAFDGEIADKFDRMSTDSGLTVDSIFHGAVMSVTERGTEAGAVTVVTMYGSAGHNDPPKQMKFNRPFVTAIIHRPTGTPVFIGRVENPEMIMKDPKVVHG